MNEQYKSFLTKTMWVAICIFAIRCFASRGDLLVNPSVYTLYGFAGEAIGLTAFLMLLYERWFWRYNPCEKTPALKKSYTGILKSSYDGKEREASLEIKQTLLSVRVTLTSGESKSNSLSASIDEIHGEKQLTYCYLNTPKSEFRYRSEVHYGTAMLCVDNPNKLTGQYYTDRKTIGDMEFTAAAE